MATEANTSSFTDILSAALDVSGIGDLDDFDVGLSLGGTDSPHSFGTFSLSDTSTSASSSQKSTFELEDGSSGQPSQEEPGLFDNLDQVEMFTQALQQLSQTAYLAPPTPIPNNSHSPAYIPQPDVQVISSPTPASSTPTRRSTTGQLRPPKPPGATSTATQLDAFSGQISEGFTPTTTTIPTTVQQISVPSSVKSLSTGESLTLPSGNLVQLPSLGQTIRLPSSGQTIKLPAGQAGQTIQFPSGQVRKTVQLSSGQSAQTIRLPSGQSGQTIRLPSGQLAQTIRLPPGQSGQTIRLPSGQTVRLPSSIQPGQIVRLPSGQTVRIPISAQPGQTFRLPSGQTVRLPSSSQPTGLPSGQTVRLPSGQQRHTIRLPSGQLKPGQVIRLPTGQTIRLPDTLFNKSASPGGRNSPTIIKTLRVPTQSGQTTSSIPPQNVIVSQQEHSSVPITTLQSGAKPTVLTIPNGKIPPGATVIRRQGKTFILHNNSSPKTVLPTTTGQSQSLNTSGISSQYLANLLNSSSNPVQVISQAQLPNHSHSPSPPPLPIPTILSRPSSSSTPPPLAGGSNGTVKTQLTSKDVSRLWSNEDIKLKNISAAPQNVHFQAHGIGGMTGMRKTVLDEEEVEEEVQELGHAETYANYMPSKVKLGIKHPDAVVETSSLSSVEPPDVWYNLTIPESTMDYGSLSALQLESIVYACQRHQTILPSGERAGYLIGDGAGVGKGRTVAGIIFENYLLGRKRALWLSVSNDLKVDAERDLRDIGAGKIDVHSLHKFKYAKISAKENGSVKKGIVFATYSSLIGESQSGGKYRTRLKQLLHWCGEDFDGVIIFDECHKAKNLCPVGSSKPTKTGQTVLELQNRLPGARIIYASATGASEPRNMAYMTRLGLWGPGTSFKEFTDFIQAVEKRGVGAMELVAMDIKLRGMYIARQLSFHGVTFKVEEVALSKDFIKVYNEAVRLWVEAREKFQRAAELIDAEQRMKKSMWGQFWSAHQRFFKYLCISAKVNFCVKLAREAVKNGKCVVIGLQSTGEARTLEQLEEAGGELNDFVSTAKGVFQTLVEKHFPAPDRRKTFDWFGLGDYSNSHSAPPSPQAKSATKRKQVNNFKSGGKRSKNLFNNDSEDDGSNASSDSDKAISDDSPSSSSESEESDNENYFNPFASGSDSDEDPWLKKSKIKSKEKKKKVKKTKKKKKTKEKKTDSMDEEFDKALEAAGLLNPNNSSFNNNVHTSSSFTTSSSFKENINSNSSSAMNNITSADAIDQACSMKSELLDKLELVGDRLPPNTLDHLIDELGGTENVAEMTGRKGRVVTNDEGGISYESRSEMDVPLEILNLTEKQRFMDGDKCIAIISEAASSGISLQADRRALNQKRRVHVTLELPWSADRAIQQFGRTHRSNQVSAPEYVFMISALAGERRFASTVAKRLESLGALTHGDRRATETRDLSRFNFDNKYGRTALEAVMKSVMRIEPPLVPLPEYNGNFIDDAQKGLIGVGMVAIDDKIQIPVLEKDYNNISKFLNRILGMEVELQNALFKYFSETLTHIVLDAKRTGRWDMGILDLGSGGECVRKVETKKFLGNAAQGTAKTELYTVCVERGMSWLSAMAIWGECSGSDDGFYISAQVRNGKRTAMLAVMEKGSKKKERLYSIHRPNTGQQPRMESLAEIRSKYRKVLPDDADPWWIDQYDNSSTVCSHAYWKGNCKRASMGLTCEIGLRTREYHILAGSVLSVWDKVESVLASMPGGSSSKMQIIRLRTDDGQRIVGSLIPSNCVPALVNVLSQGTTKTETETHTTTKQELEGLSMPMFL